MHVGTNVCDHFLKLTIIYQQSLSLTCLSIIVVNCHQAYLIETFKHYLLVNISADLVCQEHKSKSYGQMAKSAQIYGQTKSLSTELD